MPLFRKKNTKNSLLHVKTTSFNETILYSGGLITVQGSALQICKARVCKAEAHGVRVFPPL